MVNTLKKQVKIKFINGLTFDGALKEILNRLLDTYEFINSDEPDFIVFGPYGNDLPPKSDYYTRVAYYCENFTPDMSICEWAFGIPRDEEINNPRYKKIQWHNLDPNRLVKSQDIDTASILHSKTRFCNFLYGHKVPHREKFFKALSAYKKVDAPGRSMNNMPSIDSKESNNIWSSKRDFIHDYKFTIAFENYSYPGYQTEKLYDAMQEWSIPIYCGDPYIGDIFNPASFVNAFDVMDVSYGSGIQSLEKISQMDFQNMLPQFHHSFPQRVERKVKAIGRATKMRLEYNNFDYKKLVDRIIEIDQDDNLYQQILKQPWLKNNHIPSSSYSDTRWKEIFG